MNNCLLLIDDDASDRELVSGILEKCGYRVASAGSAEDGLNALIVKPYDCLIVDFYLPTMDGVSFLKEVRRRGFDAYAIILTGSADEARKRVEDLCDDLLVMSVVSKSNLPDLPDKVACAIEATAIPDEKRARIESDLASETNTLRMLPSKYPRYRTG